MAPKKINGYRSKGKGPDGSEHWVVRNAKTGELISVKSKRDATASMDRAVKKYSGALKRLAKR